MDEDDIALLSLALDQARAGDGDAAEALKAQFIRLTRNGETVPVWLAEYIADLVEGTAPKTRKSQLNKQDTHILVALWFREATGHSIDDIAGMFEPDPDRIRKLWKRHKARVKKGRRI